MWKQWYYEDNNDVSFSAGSRVSNISPWTQALNSEWTFIYLFSFSLNNCVFKIDIIWLSHRYEEYYGDYIDLSDWDDTDYDHVGNIMEFFDVSNHYYNHHHHHLILTEYDHSPNIIKVAFKWKYRFWNYYFQEAYFTFEGSWQKKWKKLTVACAKAFDSLHKETWECFTIILKRWERKKLS